MPMSGPPNNYQGVRKTRLVHYLLSCIIDQALLSMGDSNDHNEHTYLSLLVLKLYSKDKVRLEPVTLVQPLKAQQRVGA